jgi:Family of unknown function (DUF6600)/FecR protein
MKPSIRKLVWLLGAAVIAIFPVRGAWAQEYSHARVVRLSFTEGTVAIQRPDAQGWASAPVNTPIQEGFQLSTADNSFAEVEFENSSTARIGQNSLLEFPQLALEPDGGKLNHLALTQGYATFDFIAEKGDEDQVEAGPATITLAAGKSARFRTDLDQDAVRLEVFKGQVEVSGAFGAQTLSSDMVMVLRPGANPPVEVTRGITEDAWDQWVNQREEQATAARNQPTPGIYSPNVDWLYGWGDLSGFGNWVYLSSFGYGWQPSVAAGWTPYSSGRWCWYPGFGYTWISFEPWGWLPFHYGGWVYQPGFGWCWIPGGLDYWSPALVTWYQGPGWIGWAPRGPHFGNRAYSGNTCPNGSCLTAISTRAFQDGSSVLRHRMMGVRTESGVEIKRPEIKPTRAGLLTGSVLPARSVTRFGAATRATPAATGSTGQPAAGIAARPIRASETRAPVRDFGPQNERPTSVIFDPSEGRYVNNPNRTSTPAPHTLAPAAEAPSAAEPRPVAPVRSAAPRQTQPERPSGNVNFERGHNASPRSGLVRRETGGSAAPSRGSSSARPAESRPQSFGARSTPAPPQNRSFGRASRSASPERGSSVQRQSSPRGEGSGGSRSAPHSAPGKADAHHADEGRPH